MPQHPNTTRKQTQAKNKKSQKTKFLAFLATYERCAMLTEKNLERENGLEPSTSTLARLRSTN